MRTIITGEFDHLAHCHVSYGDESPLALNPSLRQPMSAEARAALLRRPDPEIQQPRDVPIFRETGLRPGVTVVEVVDLPPQRADPDIPARRQKVCSRTSIERSGSVQRITRRFIRTKPSAAASQVSAAPGSVHRSPSPSAPAEPEGFSRIGTYQAGDRTLAAELCDGLEAGIYPNRSQAIRRNLTRVDGASDEAKYKRLLRAVNAERQTRRQRH